MVRQKCKNVSVHAIKAYKKVEVWHHSVNLGTRWGDWELHALATLPLGKELCYWLIRRLNGSQNWSGCFGEKKNPFPVLRTELQMSSPQLDHYWLQYHDDIRVWLNKTHCSYPSVLCQTEVQNIYFTCVWHQKVQICTVKWQVTLRLMMKSGSIRSLITSGYCCY
jgi:hypothetical protein